MLSPHLLMTSMQEMELLQEGLLMESILLELMETIFSQCITQLKKLEILLLEKKDLPLLKQFHTELEIIQPQISQRDTEMKKKCKNGSNLLQISQTQLIDLKST